MQNKISFRQFGAVAATAVALFLTASLPAHAVPITGLFATGVDGTGTALSDGATDTHYSILSPAQQGIVVNQASVPGSWLANTSTRRWIWQTATGTPVNVDRTFRTTFDLTGLNAATASITGGWATDNQGLDILINGVSTTSTCAGFTAACGFAISSGFVSGVNTLDFVVRDVGGISGFMVSSIGGTADAALAVSAPGSFALFGLAIAGLGFARRRAAS